jgi:monoamine oxidase
MDTLPKAFLSELGENIQFGAEVIAIDYTDESATIIYNDESGKQTITGDFAIITMPFVPLRFVDILTPFSIGKQRAIRQMRYTEMVKVLLQFQNRFWETADGIYGGNTTTDLPNRQIYYPERPHATNRGVIIGTHTFTAEASRWASLPDSERIAQCLKNVAKIHPQATAEFETGVSKAWGQDKYAGGVALYYSDEYENVFPNVRKPEGAIHFAGEHTSFKHGWIEGAVESGLRAASEIHERVKQS